MIFPSIKTLFILFSPPELVTESLQSDSIDSNITLDNDEKSSTIKCDSCQEAFQTSEQFNQHRLYQCSFLIGIQCLINHEMNRLLLITR